MRAPRRALAPRRMARVNIASARSCVAQTSNALIVKITGVAALVSYRLISSYKVTHVKRGAADNNDNGSDNARGVSD